MYDGSANNYSSTITLTSTPTVYTMFVDMKNATTGQLQVQLPVQSSAGTVYFQNVTSDLGNWYYWSTAGSGSSNESLVATTYNYTPALSLNMPVNEGGNEWISSYPNVAASTQYKFSVDVAGSGQAYLDVWNGSGYTATSTVTLGTGYQTLSENVTTASSFSPAPQLIIRAVSSSSPQTIYFRNASVTPISGTVDFTTGLESGQTALTWTNTIDTTAPEATTAM